MWNKSLTFHLKLLEGITVVHTKRECSVMYVYRSEINNNKKEILIILKLKCIHTT